MGKSLRKRLAAYDKRQIEYNTTITFLERGGHGLKMPKSGWKAAFKRPGSRNPRKVRGG